MANNEEIKSKTVILYNINTPHSLPVMLENIPDELKAISQFVVWRYRYDGKKWHKPPVNSQGGLIDPHDTKNHLSFSDAAAAYQSGAFNGVGFVLTRGIVAFDFDDAVSDAGTVCKEALEVVDVCPTYWELSPSAFGLRGFVFADLSEKLKAELGDEGFKFSLEVYGTRQYVTLTGHIYGKRRPITANQRIIDVLHRQMKPDTGSPPVRSVSKGVRDWPKRGDDDVIRIMTDKDDLAAQLWRGDWQSRYNSQSEADYAFIGRLKFWTDGDTEQAERLFARSALMRPKSERRDYVKRTINSVWGAV